MSSAGDGENSPANPPLSFRLPSSPSLSVQLQLPCLSFDKSWTQSEAPERIQTDYDTFSHDEVHQTCRRRGYARQGSKVALHTRLSAMDALDRERAHGTPDGSLDVAGKRKRVDDLHHDFAPEKEAVKEHAQW